MKEYTLSTDARYAVYSRKSRDEGEDTLESHKMRINSFIKEKGLIHVDWYEEVVSGGNIEARHEFKKLLSKVAKGEYVAVIAVDMDRISRGDTYERGLIERAFKSSDTLIVTTKGEIFDYTDTNQLLTAGVKGILANFELEQSKTRLIEGKKVAVMKGRPHSGTTPYGYKWDRNTREAVIDEDASKVYRMMLDWYIVDELPATTIADKLNEMKIPTSRNGYWRSDTVRKILLNEFHMGYIVFGKYKSELTNRFNDKGEQIRSIYINEDTDEIIKSMGNHEVMKTELEHAKVVKRNLELQKYGNIKNKVTTNHFKLASLIKCPHCDSTQNVTQTGKRNPHIRKCLTKSSYRVDLCDSTVGIGESYLYDIVINDIKDYRKALLDNIEQDKLDNNNGLIIQEIELYEKSLLISNKKITKAKEMFEADIIDIVELKSRIDKEESSSKEVEYKIMELKNNSSFLSEAEQSERIKNLNSKDVIELLEGNSSFTDAKINKVLSSLILKISYEISDGIIDVKVNYR